MGPSAVALAYDDREQGHDLEAHPETAARTAAIWSLLRASGLADRLRRSLVEPATDALLERVHAPEMVRSVCDAAARGRSALDVDTYFATGSLEAARLAAGAAVALVTDVLGGSVRRGMSLMRPPGHHATPQRSMGFCIFSNVAIAARVAREDLGADRVMIVDFDVHHGNGTETVFREDPHVAFVSAHQWPSYPGTGAIDDVGSGAGLGATLNVPLPPGVGDAGYLRVFDRVVAPFARRFRPDLILASAGYDAHWRDPLAGERLSVAGFAELVRMLVALAEETAEGRLALFLEGGYDLAALAHSVHATFEVLLDPCTQPKDPIGSPPDADSPDLEPLIERVRALHGLSDGSDPTVSSVT